jgi:hypothetical protein
VGYQDSTEARRVCECSDRTLFGVERRKLFADSPVKDFQAGILCCSTHHQPTHRLDVRQRHSTDDLAASKLAEEISAPPVGVIQLISAADSIRSILPVTNAETTIQQEN